MKSRFFIFLMCASVVCQAFQLTDGELIALRDGFDARRDIVMASQVTSPWPDPATSDWGMQNFALAALYSNTDLVAANQTLIDACAQIKSDQAYYDDVFHWRGNLFYRIYKFFGHDSDYYPGRLTPAAEAAILDIFWDWARWRSKLTDAEIANSQTWYLWGSENHDAMRKTTSYSAADILKDNAPYNTYTYDDGSTAQQQYDAWNGFFKTYLRERAKKGLLVEIGSHTYSKYTLQGWYNFYDFAPDETLKKLAGMTLDIWWADWSLDQIGGVRGGGKTRIYQDRPEDGLNGTDLFAKDDAAWAMGWYYFNMGQARSKHPGVMCLATSEYRLPLVVMDIAMDISGRGTYEYKSRRPGLNLLPRPAGIDGEFNVLDPDYGGIYRYTYVAPEFVIGSLMFEKRLEDDWSGISKQNRWQGVIFANHIDARIIPQCFGTANGKTYNQQWSIQNKGTLITQKLSSGYSSQTGDMRVYFSSDGLIMSEESDWIFVQAAGAYAAVRPAWGGYSWDDSTWMRSNDDDAPVIIEAVRQSDYANFDAFKSAVLGNTLTHVITGNFPYIKNEITYTGLLDSGTFTFYANSTQAPTLNGATVDYAPDYTFDSPFMNEDWASGVVTIAKDGRQLVLDFESGTQTALKAEPAHVPESAVLHQNYPNPFNPQTIISFSLNAPSNVELSVYNTLGQKVATLMNERKNKGRHSVFWDAGNMASGIYIYKLRTQFGELRRKMVLLQ